MTNEVNNYNCNNTNLLKSSQFKLLLEIQEKTVEFFVQEVNIPGWAIGEMEVAYMAQNQQRPGDNITWNALSAMVVCDEELNAIIECHKYCFRIKNPATGELGGPEETFDAKLMILTNKNNYKHVITFHDAWIQTVSDLQLSHTTSEDDPVTFSVDIQYDYYTIGE